MVWTWARSLLTKCDFPLPVGPAITQVNGCLNRGSMLSYSVDVRGVEGSFLVECGSNAVCRDIHCNMISRLHLTSVVFAVAHVCCEPPPNDYSVSSDVWMNREDSLSFDAPCGHANAFTANEGASLHPLYMKDTSGHFLSLSGTCPYRDTFCP